MESTRLPTVTKTKLKKEDENFVTLHITPVIFKSVSRIGKADQTKESPIKVVMDNTEDQN